MTESTASGDSKRRGLIGFGLALAAVFLLALMVSTRQVRTPPPPQAPPEATENSRIQVGPLQVGMPLSEHARIEALSTTATKLEIALAGPPTVGSLVIDLGNVHRLEDSLRDQADAWPTPTSADRMLHTAIVDALLKALGDLERVPNMGEHLQQWFMAEDAAPAQ